MASSKVSSVNHSPALSARRLGRWALFLASACGVVVVSGIIAMAEDRLADRFRQLDLDADGKVTREEFPQPEFFDPLDLNGDDRITLDEARRAFLDPQVRQKFTPAGATPPVAPAPSAAGTSGASETLAPVREGPQPLKPSEHGVGRLVPDLQFADLAGNACKLSQWRDRQAIAVCMTSTSCPLSKKYLPTLAALAEKYGPQGVQFVLVNTVATDESGAMQQAASSLPAHVVYVPDGEGRLAQGIAAKSTTDVLVLDATRTVVYHGAVDDQYGFGYSLDAPRHRYLADALDAVLVGRAPAVAATAAPGCVLDEPAPNTTPEAPVSYHNRVSRIMARNCVECHRPGGVGPFELTTYEEVVAHAPMIKQVVERGIMPPWFAAPPKPGAAAHWANDRSLSAAEKSDLLAWLDGGRPAGDPQDGIKPPKYHDGWLIGKPDAVFEFAEPVPIKATGVMPYQNVLVETRLAEDKWVRSIEVQPGDRGVVHHVLVFVEPPDAVDGEPRDDAADERSGFWAIYVPGNSTLEYPPGFAKHLPKGSKLRFQMHYTPNGTATEDRTRIGLFYADGPPEHEVRVAGVANPRINIPPGANNHEEVAELRLPFDVQVLGFLPHMHLRGKACRYEVIDSGGVSQLLLDIPRYDFNWQLLYRFFDPLPLARGSTIKFTVWYDNSSQNPANPDPTKTVRWGAQTFDEMHLGYVEYFIPGAKPGEPQPLSAGRPAGRGAFAAGMLLGQIDTDGDGKVTKTELAAFGQQAPRFKDRPEAIDAMFRWLDKNSDGALDERELAALAQLIQQGRGPSN